MENEEDLEKFLQKLGDIYGKLPSQIHNICNAIKIQWVGKTLGFEKIKIGEKSTVCEFVKNKESAYYQEKRFGKILEYVMASPESMAIKQKRDIALLIITKNKILQIKKILEDMETVST